MRIVIADDVALIRSGIAAMLREVGIDTVGEAADGDELLALLPSTTPDAVVVDIRMPPTHTDEGIVAARRIRDEYPGTAVLVLSQYLDSGFALRLIEDGPAGAGYLLKERVAQAGTLADALCRVVAGESVVDPAIVGRLLVRARRQDPLAALTPRERDVLGLMAEGHSNSALCRLLSLSPKTVETHVGRVFSKLGLAEEVEGHRRVLAVLAWLRQGEP